MNIEQDKARRKFYMQQWEATPKGKAFKSWNSMKYRCCNPNCKQYKNYGARGISVCKRWMDSFSNFLEDMGERPPGLSLERIDNNGNYEPGNCKWADRYEQAQNKRTSVFIAYEGERKTVSAFARQFGLDEMTLKWRIKAGWEIEKALLTPANEKISQSVKHSLAIRWSQA